LYNIISFRYLGFDYLSNSFFFLLFWPYYFLFVANHKWKVKNRHVTVSTGMSHHLSKGFLCGHWLVDTITVANWSAYFNKLTPDIPYICYANPTKKWNTFKRKSVYDLPQNRSFYVAIGVNRTVESKSLRLWVVNFWIQSSDSSIQAGSPKKNISEGESGVWHIYMCVVHLPRTVCVWLCPTGDSQAFQQDKPCTVVKLPLQLLCLHK